MLSSLAPTRRSRARSRGARARASRAARGWRVQGVLCAQLITSHGMTRPCCRDPCRLPGGQWDAKTRCWTFPIAQHDRIVQTLQVKWVFYGMLCLLCFPGHHRGVHCNVQLSYPNWAAVQGISSVRVRLEQLHPLVSAMLRVSRASQGGCTCRACCMQGMAAGSTAAWAFPRHKRGNQSSPYPCRPLTPTVTTATATARCPATSRRSSCPSRGVRIMKLCQWLRQFEGE